MKKPFLFGTLSTVCIVIVAIVFAQVHPSGMVSYWKFDEGEGTIAYDSVGVNDGTIHGATWTTGIVGGALSFDGYNDYVTTASKTWGFSTTATVACWIKTTTTNNCGIFSLGHHDYRDELLLFLEPDGRVGIFNHKFLGNFNVRLSDSIVNDGQWHFIVGQLTGSGKLKDLHIFIDGVEETGTSQGDAPDIVDSTPRIATIGRRAKSFPFTGLIDEVAVYNRALTPEEIQQHYQNGFFGLGYLIPFTTLTLTKIEIEFNNPNNDKYAVEGEFTLNEATDGIYPVNEIVAVTAGSSTLTIAAGSFTQESPDEFEFEGAINGSDIKIEIKSVGINAFKFLVEAESVDLTGTANPVNICLLIGNDCGSDGVRLEGELKFELEDGE